MLQKTFAAKFELMVRMHKTFSCVFIFSTTMGSISIPNPNSNPNPNPNPNPIPNPSTNPNPYPNPK